MNILKRANRKVRYLWNQLKSTVFGFFFRYRYKEIKSFLVFVGYPRSGHTLIAALLDAHPNIVMSIEWAALSHLKMGYRKNAILYSIEKYSKLFTVKHDNIWTNYSYKVKNQSQGKSDRIQIIGDKLGGKTSKILMNSPDLLDKLKTELGIDIKIIHVVRNPFDTISTMAKRSLEENTSTSKEPDLQGFSSRYFQRTEVVERLKKEAKYTMYDLYHEEFIDNPQHELKKLLVYLDLTWDEEYLLSCSKIVYKSPHKSRNHYAWPKELKKETQNRINQIQFLSRYKFDK
ncbi:MAG TPA: sulfotransferase [Bacteroides sp.]|nr:sulfotransferase [Bacteroides sp.]